MPLTAGGAACGRGGEPVRQHPRARPGHERHRAARPPGSACAIRSSSRARRSRGARTGSRPAGRPCRTGAPGRCAGRAGGRRRARGSRRRRRRWRRRSRRRSGAALDAQRIGGGPRRAGRGRRAGRRPRCRRRRRRGGAGDRELHRPGAAAGEVDAERDPGQRRAAVVGLVLVDRHQHERVDAVDARGVLVDAQKRPRPGGQSRLARSRPAALWPTISATSPARAPAAPAARAARQAARREQVPRWR